MRFEAVAQRFVGVENYQNDSSENRSSPKGCLERPREHFELIGDFLPSLAREPRVVNSWFEIAKEISRTQ